MRPVSVSLRSRRPQACLRRYTAWGSESSMKGLRPSLSNHCARVSSTGSVGTAKGILAISTWRRYFPGKSTPSAKLARPKMTLPLPRSIRARCLRSRSNFWWSSWHSTRRRHFSGNPASTPRIWARLENSIRALSRSSSSAGKARMMQSVCASDADGSQPIFGTSRLAASANGKGLGMLRQRECSGRPARIRSIENSPSADKVAEVSTAPAQRRQRFS